MRNLPEQFDRPPGHDRPVAELLPDLVDRRMQGPQSLVGKKIHLGLLRTEVGKHHPDVAMVDC